MRIISGTLKGRRIQAPGNLPVRPTTDFAKESLFNVLNNRIDFEDTTVLDLFSGIGSIAFEFVSRGAPSVVCVEKHAPCIDFIRDCAKRLEMKELRCLKADAFAFIPQTQQQFHLIFADPPYDLPTLDIIPRLIFESKILLPDGLFILEHSARYDFSPDPHFQEVKRYGKVHFSFFSAN